MTDYLSRIAAKLAANREAREPPGEPKRCVGCGGELPGVTCWTERRGPGREGPYCYPCWENS